MKEANMRLDLFPSDAQPRLTRRVFLRTLTLIGGSSLLAACAPAPPPSPAAAPAKPTEAPKPAAPPPTATPAQAAQAPAAATSAPAAKPTEAPKPAASKEIESVTIGMTQDITFPDPLRNVALNDLSTLWVNVYDMLIRRRPDGSMEPWLAESFQNVNPTEWVFKLRPNVKFHNGEPMDANAVKFTYERYVNTKEGPVYDAISSVVDRAEVMDPLTVKLVTKGPVGPFIETIWEMPIVPPKYIGEVGADGFEKNPVGTGAYKFVEWIKGNRLVLERNDEHFNGKGAIKRATFRYMPEVATRLAALKAGEIDVMMQLPPDQVADVSSQAQLRVSTADTPRMIYFIIDTASPLGTGKPLEDVRVRRALTHAVNVDAIIRTILVNQARRLAVFYPPQAFGFDASLQPPAFDPEQAKTLLAEAGFPNGFNLDVDVPTGGNPIKPVEVGQAVAADFEKVGISVNLRTLDAATLTAMRGEKKTAPMYLWNFIGFDGDYFLRSNMYSKSARFVMAGWDQEIDQLLEQERTSVDPNVRADVFKKLQARLAKDVPYLALYQQNDVFGVNKRLNWDAVKGGFVILQTMSAAG
jgi:peptide/nickel transport system substrate-binding protein